MEASSDFYRLKYTRLPQSTSVEEGGGGYLTIETNLIEYSKAKANHFRTLADFEMLKQTFLPNFSCIEHCFNRTETAHPLSEYTYIRYTLPRGLCLTSGLPVENRANTPIPYRVGTWGGEYTARWGFMRRSATARYEPPKRLNNSHPMHRLLMVAKHPNVPDLRLHMVNELQRALRSRFMLPAQLPLLSVAFSPFGNVISARR